jgi:hypothetical protein
MYKHISYINHWEPYIDRIINAYWRGHTSEAQKLVGVMERMLRDSSHGMGIDTKLLDALYHVAEFYCFELEYSKAEALYKSILEVQLALNDTRISNTLIKIESVKHMRHLSQETKEGRRKRNYNCLVVIDNNNNSPS